ncbi:MAG: hypothetical protein ACXWX1_10705 [Aeromicrobium sp.]
MQLIVSVVAEEDDRPPAGASVRVEVRDVSFADVPAPVVCAAEGAVSSPSHDQPALLAELICACEQIPPGAIVWAHVDSDQDGRVSVGDYITKQAFPVPAGGGRLSVMVRRV